MLRRLLTVGIAGLLVIGPYAGGSWAQVVDTDVVEDTVLDALAEVQADTNCNASASTPSKSGATRVTGTGSYTCASAHAEIVLCVWLQVREQQAWGILGGKQCTVHSGGDLSDSDSVSQECVEGQHKYRTKARVHWSDPTGPAKQSKVARSAESALLSCNHVPQLPETPEIPPFL